MGRQEAHLRRINDKPRDSQGNGREGEEEGGEGMSKRPIFKAETQISPVSILTAVCKVWDIDPKKLLGDTRGQPVAFTRQLAMTLIYEMTECNSTQTAGIFNRGQKCVSHARKVINETMKDSAKMLDIGETIIRAINYDHKQQQEPTS